MRLLLFVWVKLRWTILPASRLNTFWILTHSKHWLQHVGSKHSRIDKCDFSDEKSIQKREFAVFHVIREDAP